MSSLIADLRSRIAMVLARGVVRLVYDGLRMQGLQVALMADEVIDRAEHPQPYGFTAHPHPGAEAVVAFPGGSRNHPLVLVVDDRRYRIQLLEQGEVAIYTDEDQLDGGHRVHLRRDQRIDVVAGQEIALRVGDRTSLVLTPDSIQMRTPEFEAWPT